MNLCDNKPWIEKYRPENFEDIILNDNNKIILKNMITNNCLHRLLFYGPPGTGKTTTILNLIKKYQTQYNERGDDLIIHLNASDERGIDIIRSQIQSFANSKTLFNKGKKFIILDEIDYMTKSAQQALKTVITECDESVCFCLICNYISRIEKSVQDIFTHFHFNSLTPKYILRFLKNVVKTENITISTNKLHKVIEFFNSDIRSMINYLQINQYNINEICIVDKTTYNKILNIIPKKPIKHIINKIDTLSKKNNISKREILKNLCYILQDYIVNENFQNSKKITSLIKYVLHDKENEVEYLLYYMVSKLKGSLLSCSSK